MKHEVITCMEEHFVPSAYLTNLLQGLKNITSKVQYTNQPIIYKQKKNLDNPNFIVDTDN